MVFRNTQAWNAFCTHIDDKDGRQSAHSNVDQADRYDRNGANQYGASIADPEG
jgi:hypothetical protein